MLLSSPAIVSVCGSSVLAEVAGAQEMQRSALSANTSEKLLRSLVFIDRSVPDYQFLQAGVVDGCLVILLDVDRDGVSQITEELARHRNVAAVHLVSHGVPGGIRLGNVELGLGSIDRYAADLVQWSEALAPQANLVIYGCEVAQGNGAALVWRLSELGGCFDYQDG
jgi:Domain of unknown function (DUF4347)